MTLRWRTASSSITASPTAASTVAVSSAGFTVRFVTDPGGRRQGGEDGFARRPALLGLPSCRRVDQLRPPGPQRDPATALPGREPAPLQVVDVGRGQPPAPAPQPVLDRLVRLLPYERLGGLVQQAVTGGGGGAGQDALAVQDEGVGVEEVEHLGCREREREIALLHRFGGGRIEGDDR